MAASSGTEYYQNKNAICEFMGVRLWAIRSLVKRETAQTAN
jgi:hypothetical protein